METLKATLSPMLVLFLCMVTGFVLSKAKVLPSNTSSVLSKLLNFIFVPSLIINTFMEYCTVTSLKQQYKTVLFSTGALIVAITTAYLLAPLFEKDAYRKNIYRYAIAFGNYGFMGNAIVPAILGDEMLYKYLIFTLPINLAVYTWGIAILIPKHNKKKSPLTLLLNPVIVALMIGIISGLLNIKKYLPSFLTSTVSNFSACMGPIAMLLTGFTIGSYRFLMLIKNKKVYIATSLRLIILPVFILLPLYLTGASKQILTLSLFAFATPLGLNTVVFPAAYGGDTSIGASMAMISHTLCVITIPVLFSLLQAIL